MQTIPQVHRTDTDRPVLPGFNDVRVKTVATSLIAGFLLSGVALRADDPVRFHATVPDGFCCDGGVCDQGWYAAVLLIEQPDEPFRSQAASQDYDQAATAVRNWQSQFVGRPRRLVLVTQQNARFPVELATADRIFGPACPQTPTAARVIAWTQKVDDTWSLMLHVDGRTRTLTKSPRLLTSPAVAATSDGFLVACETSTGREGQILLFDGVSDPPLTFPGRNPQLASAGEHSIVLSELSTRNEIRLQARTVKSGVITQTTSLPHRDDYTFNADMIYAPHQRRFIVVAESCPAFGMNDLFGQHRDIDVYALHEGQQTFVPFPADSNRLPDPRRAFRIRSVENMTPIRPQIFLIDGRPVAGYRRFRFRGNKTFGWDILLSRLADAGWSRPQRITETYGMPDTGFDLLPFNDSLLAVFAACDQNGNSSPCTSHHVRLTEIDRAAALPDTEIPSANQGEYEYPTSVRDIAPAPPRPVGVPDDWFLLFGDTHQHSTYSKCTSAYNGMPDEVLRYLRDVLDLDVLCLSEHGCYLSSPSITYTLDLCEAAAGEDRLLLFATEPGTQPGRHTNYFAVDREVFERLQLITLGHRHNRHAIYRQLKEDLPPGSVLAARHFHGRAVTGEDNLRASFDPDIEVAMEAMQGRVNAMLPGDENGRKSELFPTNFLNAGCKVGIIGGTDHYRGEGPNHFCLTGFWVKERTGAAVLEAIRRRRTVGMADAKIGLWATLNGQPMGSEVTVSDEVSVEVSVACASGVRRACLIRDGELLPWQNVDATQSVFTLTDASPPSGEHWYVVTIEADTVFKDTAIAHASPFFVTHP